MNHRSRAGRRNDPAFCWLAWALAGLFLSSVGVARAAPEQQTLSGEVSTVTEIAPGVAAALAAQGVVAGAAVTLAITLESTTPGAPASDPQFTQYDNAVTTLTLTIGSYTATYQAPGGPNIVQVGENISGPPVSDTYTLSVPALDTNNILAVGPLTFTGLWTDPGANAASDDGLIQDLTRYDPTFSFATLGSAQGQLLIVFDGGGGGPGGGGSERCVSGQLAAVAKLCKTLLGCAAKRAKAPSKDPTGSREQLCIAKGSGSFAKKHAKVVAAALKKGGTCPLNVDGNALASDFDAMLDGITSPVLADADPGSKIDTALRSGLLKAAATMCGKDLAAHAKNVRKPSPAKLAAALVKSRAKLEKAVAKAIAKSERKGPPYAGPTPEELADAARLLANTIEFLFSGGGGPP